MTGLGTRFSYPLETWNSIGTKCFGRSMEMNRRTELAVSIKKKKTLAAPSRQFNFNMLFNSSSIQSRLVQVSTTKFTFCIECGVDWLAPSPISFTDGTFSVWAYCLTVRCMCGVCALLNANEPTDLLNGVVLCCVVKSAVVVYLLLQPVVWLVTNRYHSVNCY